MCCEVNLVDRKLREEIKWMGWSEMGWAGTGWTRQMRASIVS